MKAILIVLFLLSFSVVKAQINVPISDTSLTKKITVPTRTITVPLPDGKDTVITLSFFETFTQEKPTSCCSYCCHKKEKSVLLERVFIIAPEVKENEKRLLRKGYFQ